MKTLRFIFYIVFLSSLISCGKISKEDIKNSLTDAENAINRSNYKLALDLCDDLIHTKDSTSLTWNDYCRAATIYAQAYDHDVDTDVSMASATLCLSRAIILNTDSVKSYIINLNPEYSGALNTVIRTLDGLKIDKSIIGEHEEGDYEENTEDEHNEKH